MDTRFPGMDPYIEAPDLWPGFHEAFLSYTRELLQPLLPERYYADLRTREEIGIAGLPADHVIYPDLAVKETSRGQRPPLAGVVPPPATATVPEHILVADEPLRVSFLEIREVGRGGRLVTLIELLSPSNKWPGPDREAYQRKQREVLGSEASLVEIDLLRSGKRMACHPSVEAHCGRKGYHYLVTVSRGTRRAPALDLEIYGFTVRDPFPVIAIPLLHPDPDVILDLAQVFRRAYDSGPYRKVVRYDRPPEPPLG